MFMKLALARQTIILKTGRTFVLCQSSIKSIYNATSWSGAPTHILCMFFNVIVEIKFIVFVPKLKVKKLADILQLELGFAVLLWTWNRDDFV